MNVVESNDMNKTQHVCVCNCKKIQIQFTMLNVTLDLRRKYFDKSQFSLMMEKTV